MMPITFKTTPPPSQSDSTASLRRHVAEFEGMLLSHILEKLKEAYRMPGAEETDSAAESFQSLANSALGNGLAAQGGLGVTNLLIQSLARNSPDSQLKESAQFADQVSEVGGKH